MTPIARVVLVAGLVIAAASATAQDIYRCGQTYSRVPCPNGRTIAVEAHPTSAQRAEGQQVAQREKRLADEMARDRRVAEAARQPALATSLGPARVAVASTPVKPHAKKPGKQKRKAGQTDDGRDFVATVPRVRKTPG